MYCPYCKEEIKTLDYTARYSETVYGKSNGTYDIETENWDLGDRESRDSDDWEEDDYEYTCPECTDLVDIDELLECLDEEEQEEIDKQKEIENKRIETYKANQIEIDKSIRLLKFFKRS